MREVVCCSCSESLLEKVFLVLSSPNQGEADGNPLLKQGLEDRFQVIDSRGARQREVPETNLSNRAQNVTPRAVCMLLSLNRLPVKVLNRCVSPRQKIVAPHANLQSDRQLVEVPPLAIFPSCEK